ncbi:MAG: glycosyltransferase [Deltaproteobacteria bacterium]|nr:glycosyltransferase [Deltaproteobacteria bacterium]
MRVLFDMGHPAHVHLFRIARRHLIDRGHEVFVVARQKDVTHELLKAYGIDFVPGSRIRTGGGRFLELFEWFVRVRREIVRHHIDVVVSNGSPAGAWAARVVGIPHLAFNDTESSREQRMLYGPASTKIFTPRCLLANYGPKQVRYDGIHDLAYLRPEHFVPDPRVREELGVGPVEDYAIMRFVSWDATHDWLQKKTGVDAYRALSSELARHGAIFISAEGPLPEDLKPYRLPIEPHRFHDALAFATIVVGDGCTPATEAAVLGTPSLLISSVSDTRGYVRFLRRRGLLEAAKTPREGIEKLRGMMTEPNRDNIGRSREQLLAETIDVAAYIADQCESYGNEGASGRS